MNKQMIKTLQDYNEELPYEIAQARADLRQERKAVEEFK